MKQDAFLKYILHVSHVRIKRLYVCVVITTAVLCLMAFVDRWTEGRDTESQSVTKIVHKTELTLPSRRERYCRSNFRPLINHNNAAWDFRLFQRPQFLPNYKNPCFHERINISDIIRLKLHCLPYFIIAGFPKAGTTDLWSRLAKHPDIALKHDKEPSFFNIGRYKDGSFLNATRKYISLFDKSAVHLQGLVAPFECNEHAFPYHHGITGEATVDVAFDNRHWPDVPGNEQCTEPMITNADYVHHVNPNMKIIFVVRNPTERLYSDYIYEARYIAYPTSPQLFHEVVLEALRNHSDCLQHASLRSCIYNSSIETFKVRLRVGIYHAFIKDWLRIFPPENIFVQKSEDTIGPNKLESYKELLKFLQIRPFTRFEEINIFHRGPINSRSKSEKDIGNMLPETSDILNKFYEPHNEDLYEMFPNIDYNIGTNRNEEWS